MRRVFGISLFCASDRPNVVSIVVCIPESNRTAKFGSFGDIDILGVTDLCASSETLCASDRPNDDANLSSMPRSDPNAILEWFGYIDILVVTNFCASSEVLCTSDRPNG